MRPTVIDAAAKVPPSCNRSRLLLLAMSVVGMALIGLELASQGPTWAKPLPGDPDADDEPTSQLGDDIRLYAEVVAQTAEMISLRYYREVSAPQLLAAALTALADAAGKKVPESWRNNPDKWFADLEPRLALVQYRKQMGSRWAVRGRDIEISLRGMFQVLDPHTGFISTQDRKRMYQLEGNTLGVGITLVERMGKGPLVIAEVDLGSPAHWAGILPGDRLWAINSRSVEDLPTVEVESQLQNLMGQLGQKVSLTIESAQTGRRREMELVSEPYEIETVLGFTRKDSRQWSYWLDSEAKIGYVRVLEIQARTSDRLEAALRDLTNQGMRGLILDLRDCTGGVLNAAVRIADLLLGEGPICTVRYREAAALGVGNRPGSLEQSYTSAKEGSFLGFPLWVLIGPETRGGGELIAAALQDNRRAVLVGQRTYGKATVQQSMPLMLPVGGHTEIKISVGIFVRPSGKNMQRFWGHQQPEEWGVSPDRGYEMPLSSSLQERLREWRRQRDLLSGLNNQVHPLDNPKADPVLWFALQSLMKQLAQQAAHKTRS
ncbi:MAG: S41 family peptidase [Gemmatales bacterium]|nr:S41 family peptidase [Gemmatales bacterium]MDW7994709.1 S41 family peptidase [Gemmatales bacterium]